MDKDTHVYCTDCIYGEGLIKSIEDEKHPTPKRCKNCNPYNFEDSCRLEERPNYIQKIKNSGIDTFMTDREKFNKIVNGDFKSFGIPDPMEMDSTGHFPCEFVEVIDEEKMIIKIYEPSIKKYHIERVDCLVCY